MDSTERPPYAPRIQPVSWSGYEHYHTERPGEWYIALGVIALSAAITSILFGNYFFAILIIVAAFTLGVFASRPPEEATFTLTDRGLLINDMQIPFESINAFWIEEQGEGDPMLLIDTQKFMAPHLVIPLTQIDMEIVRERLMPFVPEVELEEPLSHKLLEYLGF